MDNPARRLWPFAPVIAIIAAPILLAGLLVLSAILRKLTGWPPTELGQPLFTGILVVSLLPAVLGVLDMVAERRGVIEYRGLKLDFSLAAAVSPVSFEVPHNIGVPGQPVTDSDTRQILDALRDATANEVAIVDLKDGDAWWETRLLVLIAGAVRLARPAAMVFVATEGGLSNQFQGWAPPLELLPLILRSDRTYRESYARARAAARQWELVDPMGSGGAPPQPPQLPPWVQGLGATHPWMAFDSRSGLPNELAFEQFLQGDLGIRIEQLGSQRTISIVRLQELFRAVLRTNAVDEGWPSERQLEAILSSGDSYIAVTREKRYLRLLPLLTGLAVLMRSLVKRER